MTVMDRWTVEEDILLNQNYNKVTNDKLLTILPGSSQYAIWHRASFLGLRKIPEIAFLNRSAAARTATKTAARADTSGSRSCRWKGGVTISTSGYRMIKMPEHKRANSKGYVYEHIVIYEQQTGLELDKEHYFIRHINGVKTDNRFENLRLVERKMAIKC